MLPKVDLWCTPREVLKINKLASVSFFFSDSLTLLRIGLPTVLPSTEQSAAAGQSHDELSGKNMKQNV